MAKTKMMCPFSGQLCEECPIYRGRHYNLCFDKKYRGHLDESKQSKQAKPSYAWGVSSDKNMEIPLVKPKNAIDPFEIILKELAEIGEKIAEEAEN